MPIKILIFTCYLSLMNIYCKVNLSIKKISKDQAKDTGMAMVLILLLLGYFTHNTIFFKIAIPLLIINMIVPNMYKPLAIIWLGFSHFLGTIVSKILLTMIFFVVVTPIGLLRRLFGIDSLNLKKFKQGTKSVMKFRNFKYTKNDLEKPF